MTSLPDQLRQSLTWDQGAEMSQHVRLRIDTGLQIYFCDPQSRGNEGRMKTQTDCSGNTSQKAQT
jgi:IS30 family transposase